MAGVLLLPNYCDEDSDLDLDEEREEIAAAFDRLIVTCEETAS